MGIKYLVETYKAQGFSNTVKNIFNSYFKVNKFLVLYRDLTKEFEFDFNDPDIKCSKISLEKLISIRQKEKNLPVQFFCDISHKFSTPYIATVKDNVAAIQWTVLPNEWSRFLDIKENDIELNYNIVLPNYGGKNLSMVLLAYIVKSCKDEKRKRIFGVVNVDNIPQYKLMLRVGFEPVEVLTHFGLRRPKATLKYVK